MSNMEISRLYTHDSHTQQNYNVSIHQHDIRTTVTSKPSVVRKWVSKIRHHHRHRLLPGKLVVGLGVQWNPNKTSTTPDTLTLCVGGQCLIFQLRYVNYSPDLLHRFLYDDDVTFVGVWNNRDAGLLRGSVHGLRVGRLLDARHVAGEGNASMGRIAESVLGLEGLEKDEWVGRSEWDDEWLSEEQVVYACADAFVAFSVGKSLKAWNLGDDSDDDEDEDEY